MTTKIAISGFGRIGRLVFRLLESEKVGDLELAAINTGSAPPSYMVYQLKHDSTFGRYPGKLESDEEGIISDGKRIPVFHERDAADLPWKKLGIDIVLECSGFYTEKDMAMKHIQAGAKHVLISAPGKGGMKTVVFGVNEGILDGTEEVFSAGSCTTNCLAPMVKVLNDKFGIVVAQMTTVHAYTGTQSLMDQTDKKKNYRRGRAAAVNIVPTTTGAAKAIVEVIPEVGGKLSSAALRVPVIDGSLTTLYSILEKPVSAEEVNAAMKEAESPSFGYNEEEIVSSDVIGSSQGSLFDATMTSVAEAGNFQMVKTSAWYDNEMGYTHQLLRTLAYFSTIMK